MIMRVIEINHSQLADIHALCCVIHSDLKQMVYEDDINMDDLGYVNNRLSYLIITSFKKL